MARSKTLGRYQPGKEPWMVMNMFRASPSRVPIQVFPPWLLGLVLFVALVSPLSLSQSAELAPWMPGALEWSHVVETPLTEAFTVRSVVEPAAGAEGIILARLSPDASAASDVLRVVWAPDTSAFGFLWSLRLESDVGLLTRGPIEVAKGLPVAGHTYETLLSYDPQSGAVSLAITDLNTAASLHRGSLQAGPFSEPLWVGADQIVRQPRQNDAEPAVQSLAVVKRFLPVGYSWTVGTSPAEGGFIPANKLDVDEELVVQLSAPSAVGSGTFRLLLDQGGRTAELGRYDVTGGIQELRFGPEALPLGQIILRMVYTDDERILLADEKSLTVGQLNFALRELVGERDRGQVRGRVEITAARELAGVGMHVQAAVDEMVWDPASRDYKFEPQGTYVVLDQQDVVIPAVGLEIQFDVPLPEHPGMFQVTLQPTVTPDLSVSITENYKLFTTYAPAAVEPDESYIIAVLPDTQIYSERYPNIFLRQTQWLAEQAADRNIVLMLHMGDITNRNTPGEWRNAVRAITVLDGAMPYVLAVGNHDMQNLEGVTIGRDDTLVNRFFPVSKQPWIQGTLADDRIENSYAVFTFRGDKYLIVSLEFGPTDEAVVWASELAARHPDHRVILITHEFIARSGYRSNDAQLSYPIGRNPETTANGADLIWLKFAAHHENMFMALGGHHDLQNAISRRIDIGTHGNPVYQLATNYQFDVNGGNGFLALFEFRTDGTIEVTAYSPYLDAYRNDVNDFGFDNHFIIDTATGRYLSPVGTQ